MYAKEQNERLKASLVQQIKENVEKNNRQGQMN